ncbi:MAG: dipeptidase [Oscillospiraceae bacterium]|nr:dipeptidase [Oscillospiraceae bacterium]
MTKKPPVADAHCDLAARMLLEHLPMRENAANVSLTQGKMLSDYLQFFALWAEQPNLLVPQTVCFDQMYQNFLREIGENEDLVQLCDSGKAAERAMQGGKIAAMLSIEGAGGIACDPGRLEQARRMGVRMTTLTWNAANELAGSHITGEGLTRRGVEFVRRAQTLGILVDTSHLSERAFWELCGVSNAPIVASHSNARACCAHSRNLTDEQFREICRSGGFAGLNLYRAFLTDGQATFSDVARHLDHFLALGGEDHVCLGGDLDGCDNCLPAGFSTVADYQCLYEFLLQAGFTEPVLEKVYYKNLMRVVISCDM